MINSQEEDLRHLRKSTLQVVNYLLFVLILLIFYLAIVARSFQFEFSDYWLLANFVLLLATWGSQMLHRRNKTDLATKVLIVGLILAVDVSLLEADALQSFLPYSFLLVIALSGLLISPFASFLTALGCIFSSFMLLLVFWGFNQWMFQLIAPAILAILMAAITWGGAENLITAFGWAVDGQLRAQMRRDQLFDSQQKLQRANSLLETANIRLISEGFLTNSSFFGFIFSLRRSWIELIPENNGSEFNISYSMVAVA